MGAGGEGKAAPALRVLVVDDSPVDRKVVELLLRNHKGGAAPFHVTTVDSGKKAMEHLRLMEQGSLDSSAAHANELTVDIVLTDYCMPEMTGYDLLKAIKALSSPNPIPVVVMSSENEPQRISRCLTAGAEDFILKPLKTRDVQRLRNCSNAAARPKDDAAADAHHQYESFSSSRKLRSNQMATPGHRSELTGLTMVLHASSIELSHYFQFLFKFVLIINHDDMVPWMTPQVLHASSIELSHYFQFLFKFVLLAYAVLCLSELLHRWSKNGSVLSLWSA